MDNYISVLSGNSIRFGHIVSKFCLPKKLTCNNTVVDGLFSDCEEIWNCNLKYPGDVPYFIPIPHNGKIMLQTNFWMQEDDSVWGTWITIDLLDINGTVVKSAIEYASRKITAKSLKNSYQIIEIDVTGIELDCFSFQIKTGSYEICTQQFTKILNCKDLITFEGLFSTYDCMNNYYGFPSGVYNGDYFSYSNKIYLAGDFKFYGTENDDGVVNEIYRFTPSEKIPDFMMKYIMNKIISAKKVLINETEFKNTGNGNFTAVNLSKMFFPIMEFKLECTSIANSCN